MELSKLSIVHRIKINPFPIVGVMATIYVMVNQPSHAGAMLYFTLPLVWGLCTFLFQDILPYHRGGVALKIFYIITFAKYIITPIIVCLAGSFSLVHGDFSRLAFMYAILIQDLELIVCFASIKYFYSREYNRIQRKKEDINYSRHDSISFAGMGVIAFAVVLIMTRGVNRLLRSMRFGLVTQGLDADAFYGYDIWLAHAMMGFLVIVAIGTFSKMNEKKTVFLNSLIPLFFVILSCITIFGNNRTMILYFALCGVITFIKFFQNQRKAALLTIIPAMIAVVVSFTLMKQFRFDVSGTASLSSSGVDVSSIRDSLAAYLCGTESIAKTFHLYGERGSQMHILTIFADLANKTTILGLPGLNKIVHAFSNIPTSYKLAMYSTEIIPINAQTLFYGGYVLGPILDIFANMLVMKLLVRWEIKGKIADNEADTYVYTWWAMVLSFCMGRSLAVMYSNIVHIPMYIFLATRLNRYIKLKMGR